ncbi:MAG TPA: SDR family oxidoreductase [Acidimicrobiales bacterium]|nr:SDR family oxidoreductase [Acidimicrobiales bacterium]
MSMQGRVVVITGSNIGIGLETAVGVAMAGATTVLACRNQEKAAAAAAQVKERTGNEEVHVVALDLSDLESVRHAAEEIISRWDKLHVLVNNAGGTWSERLVTKQGFEQTLGVNHLGHFLLTNLLLERTVSSAPSRIINLSSVGHHMAWRGMRFDDLQSEKRYAAMEAYGRSKLANILFTRELSKRVAGSGVTVNAVHPGPVRSGFGMDGDLKGIMGWGNRMIRPFEISAASGAKTSIYLATSPEVEGKTGLYWVRSRPGHMSTQAHNDEQAARLWEESEKLLASVGFMLA